MRGILCYDYDYKECWLGLNDRDSMGTLLGLIIEGGDELLCL